MNKIKIKKKDGNLDSSLTGYQLKQRLSLQGAVSTIRDFRKDYKE
jgi:hypothetical protein